MARERKDTDFTINVEGVGVFVFARRTMRDEIAIQVEYARIIDGVEPTAWLDAVAGRISALKVLTVSAPAGWLDLDTMDPFDNSTYSKLLMVYAALVAKEESFRSKPAETGQAPWAGNGENNGVLVQTEVQPNQQ